MTKDFAGEKFASKEDCENRLSKFFTNSDEVSNESGIMKLPSQ